MRYRKPDTDGWQLFYIAFMMSIAVFFFVKAASDFHESNAVQANLRDE